MFPASESSVTPMNQPQQPPRETAPAPAPRRPYERPRIVKGRAVEQATLLMPSMMGMPMM
jgi:hypothetical protein